MCETQIMLEEREAVEGEDEIIADDYTFQS
jgi:hypothetical protein